MGGITFTALQKCLGSRAVAGHRMWQRSVLDVVRKALERQLASR